MFKLKHEDIEIMFEYDTIEEYEQYLKITGADKLIEAKTQHYKMVQSSVNRIADKPIEDNLKLEELWQKFVTSKKRAGYTLEYISEYERVYKKLVDYFTHRKNVFEITHEDIELFKVHLHDNVMVRGKHIQKGTINKLLNYFGTILESAKNDTLSKLANHIEGYNKKAVKAEQQKLENYTEEEMETIVNYNYKNPLYGAIIKIAVYSGMRQGEIRTLEQENIVQDKKSGIWYFDIVEAKSEAGVRQIPIHNDILDLVLNLSFPLIPELVNNKNAFGKRVRRALYSAVDQENKKFHTLRANFIDNTIDNSMDSTNPFALNIIKTIVGHAENENNRLTLIVYKKGFKLQDKKEFMDRVNYSLV